jgi:hypothetical protein
MECDQRLLGMVHIGCGDGDAVQIIAGAQLAVISVNVGNLQSVRHRTGAVAATATKRYHFSLRVRLQSRDMTDFGEIAGAKDPEA